MAKSTDIKVKLSSVDEVKQFVDVMRGYHGDVDISATTVKFYDGISDSYMSTLKPFIAEPAVA